MISANINLIDDRIISGMLEGNLKRIILQGRKCVLPPPDITVSEWADQNRMLPETSAEPGRWRTSRVPHSKAIMDTVTDPRVRQITIMGSSQIGKTEIMNNIIGYFIDIDPCSIMIMQPTDKDARDYSMRKLGPMLEDTRCLQDKVSRKKKGDSDNALLRKKFIGGHLTIVSGNTTSSTRQRSARVTIADDIDGIEIGHTKEGDPVSRLIKRSTTYPDSLNINISTPTAEGCRIEKLYKQSNMQKYYVRCPYCQAEQILKPENLDWKKEVDFFGKPTVHYPETVRYACEGCGSLLTEGQRMEMLQKGYWKAERLQITDHMGFWINELSSTLSSMEKVAKAIIDSEKDPDKLEVLYNTVYGQPYNKVQGEETDPVELMDAVEDYIDKDNPRLPNDILCLTAAVDVQAGSGIKEARLEVKVMGWGLGKERWIVYHLVIPGNPTQRYVWDILDEFWQKKWFRKDGIEIKIMRKFIDSGYAPQSVYEYTRHRQHEGIYAIKGSSKYGASLLPRKAGLVDKGRTMLLLIGTQSAKCEIYSCLKRIKEPGPKYTHFAKAFCNSEYFRQLTAEHGVRKSTGMIDYIYYEKKKRGDANEALDLFVYNLAAMEHLNPKFEAIKRNYDAQLERMKSDVKSEEQDIKAKPRPIQKQRLKININSSMGVW